MSEQYPDAHIGAQNLLYNRLLQGQLEGIGETRHTPPSFPHYKDRYYWDAVAHSIVSAEAGVIDPRWLPAAKDEILDLVDGIEPNGDLPNIRFANNTRKFDPERILAFEKNATSSNYTQPPVLALGIRKIYDVIKMHDEPQATELLESVYDKARLHYEFLFRELSNNDENMLIGIYHPHMTGRDSDPTFDGFKLRIPRRGPDTPKFIDKLNIPLDYFSVLRLGMRLKKAKGDYSKMREIYWVNDVMMNCIYADNLSEMSELAWINNNIEDAIMYEERSKKVEQRIINDMWSREARKGKGAFLALDSEGGYIDEISISNLAPLMLPNLPADRLESLLDLMDVSFNTNYPLPSVATDSPNYDPRHNEADRIWRGSTWMITNWLIVRGLHIQMTRRDYMFHEHPDLGYRCAVWADRIAEKSRELLDISGRREFYDPDTGKGQRKSVNEFGWSNLGYVM